MLLTSEMLSVVAAHKPQLKSQAKADILQAAVALIFRDGKQGTEVLMIQRAKDKRDPWSGQMAFPGGKNDPQDSTSLATAIRETLEEVGVKLDREECLGQLNDFYGFHAKKSISVALSSFVFKCDKPLNPKANYEVAEIVWVPLKFCDDPTRSCTVKHPLSMYDEHQGIVLDERKGQILWGLSLRVLLFVFDLIDLPMQALKDADSIRMINEIK